MTEPEFFNLIDCGGCIFILKEWFGHQLSQKKPLCEVVSFMREYSVRYNAIITTETILSWLVVYWRPLIGLLLDLTNGRSDQ